MSNLLYPGLRHNVTDIPVNQGISRARQLHAASFMPLVEGGVAVARAVVTFARKIHGLVKQWHARRQTYAQLMRMSDHQLNDIGIVRGEIEDIVYGRRSGPGPARRLFQVLARTYKSWRARQIARAHLAALDDHVLMDIGLTRADIEAAVRGRRVRRQQPANENLRPVANDDSPRNAA